MKQFLSALPRKGYKTHTWFEEKATLHYVHGIWTGAPWFQIFYGMHAIGCRNSKWLNVINGRYMASSLQRLRRAVIQVDCFCLLVASIELTRPGKNAHSVHCALYSPWQVNKKLRFFIICFFLVVLVNYFEGQRWWRSAVEFSSWSL